MKQDSTNLGSGIWIIKYKYNIFEKLLLRKRNKITIRVFDSSYISVKLSEGDENDH